MGIIDFFLNLLSDPRGAIAGWIITLGAVWVYTPLFLIVFVETGLVFFPFLPGDSLLFAAGVFSADGGGLHLGATLLVFYAAAILGNTSNYWIARFFGRRIIDSGKVKALTPERMAKLDSFFEKYGGLTIVITRFMPFFRTFAPFIAGTGHMNFAKFTMFNAIGGISWVSLFVLVGYFFGGVPFVQEHFELVLVLIIAISVVPAAIGAIKGWQAKRRKAKAAGTPEQGMGGAASVTSVPGAPSQAPASVSAPAAPTGDGPAVGRHFASARAGAAPSSPLAPPAASGARSQAPSDPGSTEAWLIAAGIGLTTAVSTGDSADDSVATGDVDVPISGDSFDGAFSSLGDDGLFGDDSSSGVR